MIFANPSPATLWNPFKMRLLAASETRNGCLEHPPPPLCQALCIEGSSENRYCGNTEILLFWRRWKSNLPEEETLQEIAKSRRDVTMLEINSTVQNTRWPDGP